MGKTEPLENLHQPLCTFKCSKVITHECPHINVLSIETSSSLNAETEPRMKLTTFSVAMLKTFMHGHSVHDDLSALEGTEWLMQIFPITMPLHPRFSFNMQVWLYFKHLCMDIHA